MEDSTSCTEVHKENNSTEKQTSAPIKVSLEEAKEETGAFTSIDDQIDLGNDSGNGATLGSTVCEEDEEETESDDSEEPSDENCEQENEVNFSGNDDSEQTSEEESEDAGEEEDIIAKGGATELQKGKQTDNAKAVNVNGNDDSEQTSEYEGEDADKEEDIIDKGGATEVENGKQTDNAQAVEGEPIPVQMKRVRGAGKKDADVIKATPKNKKRQGGGWMENLKANKVESKDKPEPSIKREGKLEISEPESSRKRRKSEVESRDKAELSDKRQAKRRVESMGMIFMCSSETKNDCYQYRIFGLPESKKDAVKKIYVGMRLFLYDIELKLMHGIYKAAGLGGYNIEPKAFRSQFPSQVRFKVHRDCLPLPEEMFRKVIKDNYFTRSKFDCRLNSQQVHDLCDLFISSGNVPPSVTLGSSKLHKNPSKRRERRSDYERGNSLTRSWQSLHSHKRPRRAVSPVETYRQPLPPTLLPWAIPQYVYEMPSNVDTYRQEIDPRHQSPYRTTWNPYNHGSSELSRAHEYYPRDARDSFVEPDPYIGVSDHIAPYRELRRDAYPEYLSRYRNRDLEIDGTVSMDSQRDRQHLYLDPSAPFQDRAVLNPYPTYSKDPLSGAYHVPYIREMVEYRDPHPPASVSRHPYGVLGRDFYTPHREHLTTADPIHSAEYYPSRKGHLRDFWR